MDFQDFSIHDLIPIIAILIAAIGWFVNSHLNRKHEIAKRRMEHRMDALQSFVPVFFLMEGEGRGMSSHEFHEKFAAARTKFQLYCNKNEIDAFEHLIATMKAKDNKAFKDALANLIRLVREGIRGELGLSKYEYPE